MVATFGRSLRFSWMTADFAALKTIAMKGGYREIRVIEPKGYLLLLHPFFEVIWIFRGIKDAVIE